MNIIKRNGSTQEFTSHKIANAILASFFDTGEDIEPEDLDALVSDIEADLLEMDSNGERVTISIIQERTEYHMMICGHHSPVRSFIVHRSRRDLERAKAGAESNGLVQYLKEMSSDLESVCVTTTASEIVLTNPDDVLALENIEPILLGITPRIELDFDYDILARRVLLSKIYAEVENNLGIKLDDKDLVKIMLGRGLKEGIYGKEAEIYLEKDNVVTIDPTHNDDLFNYMGLSVLYYKYLTRDRKGNLIETPQLFWMRVAMGICSAETNAGYRALVTYEALSSMSYIHSTPTLFNSLLKRPQTASCYILQPDDSIEGIFNMFKQNAHLSKYAGGLGNDWTAIRGNGAEIKGTNGESQGIIPFLKMNSGLAVAVNQSSRRVGSIACYLAPWHSDFQDFLSIKKETGDPRRLCHDLNTAAWIPDVFMRRVKEDGRWGMFSPNEAPNLHGLVGDEFTKEYERVEALGIAGELRVFKDVSAVQLWREMLVSLYETSGPWICFSDPSNLRYANGHKGSVHSSNLCTEILLHTSPEETAVCMLATISVPAHVGEDRVIDMDKLEKTVSIAIRSLDNLIEYNYYPTEEAKRSNMLNRPLGCGMIGLQDAYHKMKMGYGSEEAVSFAGRFSEAISYFAIKESIRLAKTKGKYPNYEGSLWDQGLMPHDTYETLKDHRSQLFPISTNLDWDSLRSELEEHGIRNGTLLSQPPTATVSLLTNLSQSTEPTYQHMYIKSNHTGDFTVVNQYLVKELKERGIWGHKTLVDLKRYSGTIENIDYIPDDIKERYQTAFDVDPFYVIKNAAVRQQFFDQGQSVNLYVKNATGKKLNDMYMMAWERGLKTTYYLRTLRQKAGESNPDIKDIDDGCEMCQ